jgi:hypothetical protein
MGRSELIGKSPETPEFPSITRADAAVKDDEV